LSQPHQVFTLHVKSSGINFENRLPAQFFRKPIRNNPGRPEQGCQMVSFQTKHPNLGIFWRTLEWKLFLYIVCSFVKYFDHWVYLMGIWQFCSHLVYFSPLWYFLPRKIWQPWARARQKNPSAIFLTNQFFLFSSRC
jgi:hypothetical protein